MTARNNQPTADQLRSLIRSAREAVSAYTENNKAWDDLRRELDAVERMVGDDSKKKNLGNRLVKLGVTMFIIPEPVVSNIAGAALLTAGLAIKRMNQNTLKISDVHQELHRYIREMNQLRKEMSSIQI